MEALLDFARGPLFRVTFAIMVLGLLRVLILDLWSAMEAYRKAGDKRMHWRYILKRSTEWYFPIRRIGRSRPIYSLISVTFHIGLILVPIFLWEHVLLWRDVISFEWWTLSKPVADFLTITTMAAAFLLFVGRAFTRASSYISRKQDFLWPLMLLVPFGFGYVCANVNLHASTYTLFMLIHVLSAELIFILMPFTKIAHCVLMPISQVITNVAWKFPARTDEDVRITLDREGTPV